MGAAPEEGIQACGAEGWEPRGSVGGRRGRHGEGALDCVQVQTVDLRGCVRVPCSAWGQSYLCPHQGASLMPFLVGGDGGLGQPQAFLPDSHTQPGELHCDTPPRCPCCPHSVTGPCLQVSNACHARSAHWLRSRWCDVHAFCLN